MCNQSISVGDLVDLVELENDKSFGNLKYLNGIVTEICPNNLLKVSVGDDVVISVNRNKVQKWIQTPATATVSKTSLKSKRLTRLPKLRGLDADCAALVKPATKTQKNSRETGSNEARFCDHLAGSWSHHNHAVFCHNPITLHSNVYCPHSLIQSSASQLFSQVA